MSNYIRTRHGNTYFFTVVTWKRRPILCIEPCRVFLREAINEVRTTHPFIIKSWVLLPDHMHCMWELPEGDSDYSKRWGLIKVGFTKKVRSSGRKMPMVGSAKVTRSRLRHHEGTIWQRRFWEHMIRDEKDYRAHCDYIHFNPVKHGLTDGPGDWPYSTFHAFVNQEIYSPDWGRNKEVRLPSNVGRE